jgi:hypothetical protein
MRIVSWACNSRGDDLRLRARRWDVFAKLAESLHMTLDRFTNGFDRLVARPVETQPGKSGT